MLEGGTDIMVLLHLTGLYLYDTPVARNERFQSFTFLHGRFISPGIEKNITDIPHGKLLSSFNNRQSATQ